MRLVTATETVVEELVDHEGTMAVRRVTTSILVPESSLKRNKHGVLKIRLGVDIMVDAVPELLELVNDTGVVFEQSVNGGVLRVQPGDTPERIYAYWLGAR
jgi:hypothetical protein